VRHALGEVDQLRRGHLVIAYAEVPLGRNVPDALRPVQFVRHGGFFVDELGRQLCTQSVVEHHQGRPFEPLLMLCNVDLMGSVYQLRKFVDIPKDQHVGVHEYRNSSVITQERGKVTAEGEVCQAPTFDGELREDKGDNLDRLRGPPDYRPLEDVVGDRRARIDSNEDTHFLNLSIISFI